MANSVFRVLGDLEPLLSNSVFDSRFGWCCDGGGVISISQIPLTILDCGWFGFIGQFVLVFEPSD